MCLAEKVLEVPEGPVPGINIKIVCNVIAVILKRRGIKREEPDGGDAKVFDVVQFFYKPPEVAYTVTAAVMECLDMQFVNSVSLFVIPAACLPVGRSLGGNPVFLISSGRSDSSRRLAPRCPTTDPCLLTAGAGFGHDKKRAIIYGQTLITSVYHYI
jgi:hypothetical protein